VSHYQQNVMRVRSRRASFAAFAVIHVSSREADAADPDAETFGPCLAAGFLQHVDNCRYEIDAARFNAANLFRKLQVGR
jgi:hypothetical protein